MRNLQERIKKLETERGLGEFKQMIDLGDGEFIHVTQAELRAILKEIGEGNSTGINGNRIKLAVGSSRGVVIVPVKDKLPE